MPDFNPTLMTAPGFHPYSAGGFSLNVEFLDRVDGQNRGGVSSDARAVDDALAGVWLAVKEPSMK